MSPPARTVKRLALGVAVVALVAAVIIDTPFLTPEEAEAINPPPFSAEAYAEESFPEIADAVSTEATDISVLAPMITSDAEAAGREYGTDIGSGKYAYAIIATGTVTEADANFLLLDVPDLPEEVTVRVALGSGVSGSAIRDVTGEISFSDFPGQTEYQSVANAYKTIVAREVVAGIDPASLVDQEISVDGVWSTGGPPDSYVITPVAIEVSS
jgi:predicted lipoprotein